MDTKTLGLLYDTAKKQQQQLERTLAKLDRVSAETATASASAVVQELSSQTDQIESAADAAVSALNTARSEAQDYEKRSNLRSVLFFLAVLGLGLGVLFVVKLTLIPSFDEIEDLKAQVRELERQGGNLHLIESEGVIYVRVDPDSIRAARDGRGAFAVTLSK